MEINSKIYIAGHTGMVGSAIKRNLETKGYHNIITCDLNELNLINQQETEIFFQKEKPEYVFLAAAKVGGIVANNTYRAQFIYENIQIQNNIIHFSYKYGVKKLLFLGSSCIYPKNAQQPINEDALLTAELEYTNEPYAIAKIAGLKMCESYNIQYGTNFISVMPTNLYGLNDNYNLETSHVLPAILRKLHLAKCLEAKNINEIRKDFAKRPVDGFGGTASEEEIMSVLNKYGIEKQNDKIIVKLFGTGKPRREFLVADDAADACVFLMKNFNFSDFVYNKNEIRNCHLNIGTGFDIEIAELVEIIKQITGFQGNIFWDKTKPDGTMKKQLDVSKIKKMGWLPKMSLTQGIENVYVNY
ncbi:MAG: GDP-fucose synthetase, partial [Bacteroidetes bacterium RIFOXYA12_FULL_35_11]